MIGALYWGPWYRRNLEKYTFRGFTEIYVALSENTTVLFEGSTTDMYSKALFSKNMGPNNIDICKKIPGTFLTKIVKESIIYTK